jgi:hypothetical protein
MYYGRACDPCTILPALNEIASEQASPTTKTIERTNMLMDYLHNYPNAVIQYYASDMLLKTTVDAAYLVLPKARSSAAAHYHLGWEDSDRANGADSFTMVKFLTFGVGEIRESLRLWFLPESFTCHKILF